MNMERRKIGAEDHSEATRPRRVGAVILIGLGIIFLLGNLGVLSVSDIGQFFGSLGGGIGQFFGNLGSGIGTFFGNLGSSIANLWPLVFIIAGAALLLRRNPAPEQSHPDDKDA